MVWHGLGFVEKDVVIGLGRRREGVLFVSRALIVS